MNCEPIKDLLEAYAVGALEPHEQEIVEQHLAGCADCRQLAQQFEHAASLLPQALAAVSPLRPPDSLKERLLQAVQSEPSNSAATAPIAPERNATVTSPQARASFANGKPEKAPPRPSVRPRWGWLRTRAPAMAALSVLLVLAIILGAQLSLMLAESRALQIELSNLFDQQELVLEVVDSPRTVRRVLLAPEPREDSPFPSYGKLFTRTDMRHVVAMVARLPQPPTGQAYHLWLSTGGLTQLAGTMSVNDQGFGLLVFDADRDGPIYESAQLTLQSVGSTTPAGDPILVWQAEDQP